MSERINPFGQSHFIPVPVWLSARSHTEISQTAKLVYGALAYHAGSNGYCFPGQSRLAAEIGVSDRSIRNAIKELQTLRLIDVEKRGANTTDRYYFLKHEWIFNGPVEMERPEANPGTDRKQTPVGPEASPGTERKQASNEHISINTEESTHHYEENSKGEEITIEDLFFEEGEGGQVSEVRGRPVPLPSLHLEDYDFYSRCFNNENSWRVYRTEILRDIEHIILDLGFQFPQAGSPEALTLYNLKNKCYEDHLETDAIASLLRGGYLAFLNHEELVA